MSKLAPTEPPSSAPACGSFAEVSAAALGHNLSIARRRAGKAETLCVVKADAYGHGAALVAPALQGAGAHLFGVATPAEALELRAAGVRGTILVLAGASWWGAPELLVEGDLVPVLSSVEELVRLDEHLRTHAPGKTLTAHLKLDTGMARIGLPVGDAPGEALAPFLAAAAEAKRVQVRGACTHFANADLADAAFTTRQVERFRAALKVLRQGGLPLEVVHLSNSAATLSLGPIADEQGLDVWVRPGLMLYGLSPFHGGPLPAGADPSELAPVLRWTAPVVVRKRVPKGTPVSYGSTFVTERETELAVLGIGYADGYPRALSGKGAVAFAVEGRDAVRAPILGRVCMDLTVVDVTDVVAAAGPEPCALGRHALLVGESPSAWEVADWADTIAYEVTTRIGKRVPRILLPAG